jgi:tetratricopeptide (TPR) repeat protein
MIVRAIDWKLSALQIASMLCSVLLTIALLSLYHHLTDNYFTPLPSYIRSINLALPPLAAISLTYALTFLIGEKVSDTPKLVIRFLRNTFFQSRRAMSAFIALTFLVSFASWYYIDHNTPPYYDNLIAKLLGGEQDRQQLIGKEIKSIAEKNPEFAKELQLAVDVFSLRSKWNFSNKAANTTEPRILVRALEANNMSHSWEVHPLRKHALGEAYSMWAQAAFSSRFSIDTNDWKSLQKKSIAAYKEVIESKSPLATPLMRSSAINNTGNAYLYLGDLDQATAYYGLALRENKNLSTAGNLIAALILLNKTKEAERLGEEMIEWGDTTGKATTEGSSYSGVVGNTALAYMIDGDAEKGARLMLEAYDLEGDDLNALNLAAALRISGRAEQASDLMTQHFKYAQLEPEKQAERVSEKYNQCYYLVAAAFAGQADILLRATYLYTYLGEPRTLSQLKKETAASLKAVTDRVEKAVLKDAGSCKDLLLIPKFKSMLEGA